MVGFWYAAESIFLLFVSLLIVVQFAYLSKRAGGLVPSVFKQKLEMKH